VHFCFSFQNFSERIRGVSGKGYHGAAIRSAARPFGDPGEQTFRRQSCEEAKRGLEKLVFILSLL
jgi:hypothetical protein